jgi:hypothetical protein
MEPDQDEGSAARNGGCGCDRRSVPENAGCGDVVGLVGTHHAHPMVHTRAVQQESERACDTATANSATR